MVTKIIDVKTNFQHAINAAIDCLASGEIIAFPTETVYGLGADIFNTDAVDKIFHVKNRPTSNPLAAHISSLQQVEELSDLIPEQFYVLAEKFLPGPLSVIIKKNSRITKLVTGGLNTIAIRMPDNEFALSVISTYGKPLAATSANISGMVSPVNAGQVYNDLKDKIRLILDDGDTKYGMESTVIDISGCTPVILRPGVIRKEEIEDAIGTQVNLKTNADIPHYRTSTPTVIFNSINELNEYLVNNPKKNILILTTDKLPVKEREQTIITAGNIYSQLRNADRRNFDTLVIYYEINEKTDSTLADRLNFAGK